MGVEVSASDAPTKVWNRRFVHLLLIEWSLQFGIYATTPIASNYAVSIGAAIGIAGFIAGINSTVSLCMRPFTGWITDNLAKKSLLILSSLLFTIAGFGCAFAPSLELLGFFRATQGIAFALKSVILVGFVAFIVPHDYVGTAVGFFTIASTVASALAPTVGELVGSTFGYSNSFLVAGCFYLFGFILILLFKLPEAARQVEEERKAKRAALSPEERKFKFDIREFFFLPAFVPSVLGGLASLCFAIISSFVLMASSERGIEGASIYFIMYSICAFVCRPTAGRLLDSKGYAAVYLPMSVVMSAAPIVLMFADNFIWVALAGVIFGVGHSSSYAASQAYAVKMAPLEASGRSVNTFLIGPDIGMGLGPWIGGIIYQMFGSQAMFGFIFLVGALAFSTALVLKLRKVI